MATKAFPQYPNKRSNLPEVLDIHGEIVTNGDSPSIHRGKGFEVSQEGTGIYRVTLNRKVGHIVTAVPYLVKASTSQTFVEVVSSDDSNNYVDFRVVNNAGTASAPGNVADRIGFKITVMAAKLPVK